MDPAYFMDSDPLREESPPAMDVEEHDADYNAVPKKQVAKIAAADRVTRRKVGLESFIASSHAYGSPLMSQSSRQNSTPRKYDDDDDDAAYDPAADGSPGPATTSRASTSAQAQQAQQAAQAAAAAQQQSQEEALEAAQNQYLLDQTRPLWEPIISNYAAEIRRKQRETEINFNSSLHETNIQSALHITNWAGQALDQSINADLAAEQAERNREAKAIAAAKKAEEAAAAKEAAALARKEKKREAAMEGWKKRKQDEVDKVDFMGKIARAEQRKKDFDTAVAQRQEGLASGFWPDANEIHPPFPLDSFPLPAASNAPSSVSTPAGDLTPALPTPPPQPDYSMLNGFVSPVPSPKPESAALPATDNTPVAKTKTAKKRASTAANGASKKPRKSAAATPSVAPSSPAFGGPADAHMEDSYLDRKSVV